MGESTRGGLRAEFIGLYNEYVDEIREEFPNMDKERVQKMALDMVLHEVNIHMKNFRDFILSF